MAQCFELLLTARKAPRFESPWAFLRGVCMFSLCLLSRFSGVLPQSNAAKDMRLNKLGKIEDGWVGRWVDGWVGGRMYRWADDG